MQCNRTVIALLLLTSSLGYAQDTTPSERETIQKLVQQVKELQDEVKLLETQRASDANQSAVPQPVGGPAPAEEKAGSTQRESLAQELHELHGIQWRGFGEVDYKVLNQRTPELGTYGFVPGSHGNFYTGDFDLLLTSRINDKASILSEIVFGEQDAQRFGVDLERVLFKYDYNDHLRMSFGRYQTGIGYYNTAFHSGSWLQTTADRPLIMEFANHGGPLPTQAVGVSVTGEIPSGKMGLNYVAEYGSSDTIRPDLNGTGTDDENNGNHFNLGLFVRPIAIPGLQVGGSIYHDQISDIRRGPSVRLGQTIANVHLVYTAHGIEVLNEGFLIRHKYEQSSIVYNMPAFYSQVSKQFGRLRPFLRYQYINANPGSLFDDIALRHGPSFGARWDFNDNIAFKTQLDHTLRKGQPDLNGLHLQLAFTF
ncbi:MAG TPA: hypothetical protein VI386_32935 [Candidatus Sulfotelmatobacter sp.]